MKDEIAEQLQAPAEPAFADARVEEFDMDSALGFLFRRLNSLSNMLFATTSQQTDITPMQMGILLKVRQAGLIALRDLAEQMRVDRSTLQEVVKRMVEKGLLSRRTPPNDKRAHELWLGPDGTQVIRRYFHAMEGLQGRLLKDIPPEDAQVTIRTLKTILNQYGF